MLVIVDPSEAESFEQSIEKLSNGTVPKSCKWTFEELWAEFSGWDALFVSHCHGKKQALMLEKSNVYGSLPITIGVYISSRGLSQRSASGRRAVTQGLLLYDNFTEKGCITYSGGAFFGWAVSP